MTTIALRGVSAGYRNAEGQPVEVVKDISLEISTGEIAVLFGPNGVGKSTLLATATGQLLATSGSVSIEGDSSRPPRVAAAWQDYRTSLLPWCDLLDNLAFPLRVAGVERDERRRQAQALLAEVAAHLPANAKIASLSGGQQQLVSVLRALLCDPDFLALDEPFSALDQPQRWALISLVERHWLKKQPPVILVTHDLDEGILLADRILLMGQGSGILAEVRNHLPRPRGVAMLTSDEHIACRKQVIQFLAAEAAARESINVH